MFNFILKFLLLTLVSYSLIANEDSPYTISLEKYRLNGIISLEREMDMKLTSKKYWLNYLQNKDTKFGFIEEYSSVLTCNKEKSTLTLFMKNSDQKYEFKRANNAYTGKNKGDKTKEGDQKTPIGIYKIIDKLSKNTNLDPFYGPLAFVTSYPNTYDTYLGKEGHGIWIHGLPTQETRDEFTRGCIAIQNSNIECLDKDIKIDNTLLIINDKEIEQNIKKETLASLLSELYKWRYTWLYNDLDGYLNFYSNDFVRYDGVKYERFKRYKTRVFQKNEKKTIIFTNINIVPYPSTKDIFQITFKEYYKSDSFEFSGDKTLMVRLNNNNKMKIFTEK
jgi:murein L,D-transpeptidase YafK